MTIVVITIVAEMVHILSAANYYCTTVEILPLLYYVITVVITTVADMVDILNDANTIPKVIRIMQEHINIPC